MALPLIFHSLEAVSFPVPAPLFLAVGMFDGLHLGHQAVIGSAVAEAAAQGGRSGVLTFWPHPSALMNPEKRSRMMMSPHTKRGIIGSLGVEFLVEQEFTHALSRMTPEQFVDFVSSSLPGLKGIHVGANWRFGARRSGDVHALGVLAGERGIAVRVAAPVLRDGQPVSSSRIREQLLAGHVRQAGALLGYPYFAEGTTVEGRRLGRTLGFPTLNLPWEPELKPAHGVYVMRVRAAGGGPWYPAVGNYGVRPTVEERGGLLLELHLLGECPFVYGDGIVAEWLHFLRPEQRFGRVEELRAQIALDASAASDYFRLQT